jgi:ubiquinone/menaquinone biosynthesis C-methylase UbiE
MINNEKYWERRFESGEWEASKGSEQTIFHYDVLFKFMPDWLKKEISDNKMSICDLGCGMGEGVNLLKEFFKKSKVTGVDFSQSAIKKAEKKYSNIFFIRSDINEFEKNYDVIISSHTLEHFENPFELFSKMMSLADKYFVLIIPFQEKELWREHCYTFDYNFFPISIQDYELVHYKEIDKIFYEAGGYWAKEQILVVYANTTNLEIDKFSLAQLNNTYFHELKQQKQLSEEKLNTQKQKHTTQINQYQEKLNTQKQKHTTQINQYQEKLNTQKQKHTTQINQYQEKLEIQKQVYGDKFYGLSKQAEYFQKKAKCLQEKNTKLEEKNTQNINKIKILKKNNNKIKILEKNDSHIKKQLKIIANTKPYRLAYALRRFSHEFLKGDLKEKKNFLKWIYCKLARKKCGLEYKYNPLIGLVKK